MTSALLHFAIGAAGSLALFLLFTWLSGARSFSAPFVVVFIGLTCAALSHFLSPWATPVVLVLYGAVAAVECRNDRIAAGRKSRQSAPP